MTITLLILLTLAVIYAFAVSALYRSKSRQSTKFYNSWRESVEHNVELATTGADLREQVAQLTKANNAKQREIDSLKAKAAEAEARQQQRKERARNFKHAADNAAATKKRTAAPRKAAPKKDNNA